MDASWSRRWLVLLLTKTHNNFMFKAEENCIFFGKKTIFFLSWTFETLHFTIKMLELFIILSLFLHETMDIYNK